jgi:hypothetical protein
LDHFADEFVHFRHWQFIKHFLEYFIEKFEDVDDWSAFNTEDEVLPDVVAKPDL